MAYLTYIWGENMTTNTSMTFYHKTFDSVKKLNKWTRYLIDAVMWQGGKGASINKGYVDANDVRVWIPKDENDLTNITFDIGDIIVKGDIELDITKQSDLQDIDDVYNITTILNQDFGSESMNHFELGGK